MKHIVGFSGGIDSQRCALWVRERYDPEDIILTNSPAGGWEDPLTVQFIVDYSTSVFPDLKGRSIYDLIAELQAERDRLAEENRKLAQALVAFRKGKE